MLGSRKETSTPKERQSCGPEPGTVQGERLAGRTYANDVDVVPTPEEVSLLFGVRHARQAGRPEKTGRITNRVIISPSTARELVLRLGDCIKDHQARFGPRGEGAGGSAGSSLSVPAVILPFKMSEKAAGMAERLIGAVRGLGANFGFERSFKMSRDALYANRFLLLLCKSSFGKDPDDRIMKICGDLGMPARQSEMFRKSLPEAGFVHFGFEEGPNTSLYKAYLEFWTNWDEQIAAKRKNREPSLVYLGFKWEAGKGDSGPVTRYTWHPCLDFKELRMKVEEAYGAANPCGGRSVALGLLDAASARTAPHNILYLEVTEEANRRRSFDVNFYRAGLHVRDAGPLLTKACSHYKIEPETFGGLYSQAEPRLLGHISGGAGRRGEDFLTVYYGLEGH